MDPRPPTEVNQRNCICEGSGPETEALKTEIGQLSKIMLEQTEILRRMDARQAATNLSRQPIPQVPATSSSAWNPLLKSFLGETIQPQVDRWKSGLDALLVFLGLFSAIVTSFFIASQTGLAPDKSDRTNELLANLTEIVIMLSNKPADDLDFSPPSEFRPEPSNIRLNSYYSLSLVLSLSIATLAVAGRGFLNMVAMSQKKGAAFRLADIHRRWASAETSLRPAIEALPQLLVLPVLLFIVGVLDMLLSTILEISPAPRFILGSTVICLLAITVVAVVLVLALIDATIHPSTSAFQSATASLIVNSMPFITAFLRQLVTLITVPISHCYSAASGYKNRCSTHPPTMIPLSGAKSNSKIPYEDIYTSYHETIQQTHDDTVLDQAASALQQLVLREQFISVDLAPPDAAELATLIHLLSPEASFRSNITAASIVADIQSISQSFDILALLLRPLLDALERYHVHPSNRVLGDIWDSPFTLAIAHIVGEDNHRCPSVVRILASRKLFEHSFEGGPHYADHMKKISQLMWQVMEVRLRDAAQQDTEPQSRATEMCSAVPLEGLEKSGIRALMDSMFVTCNPTKTEIEERALWLSNCVPFDVIIEGLFRTVPFSSAGRRRHCAPWVHSFVDKVVEIIESTQLIGRDLLNLSILSTTNIQSYIKFLPRFRVLFGDSLPDDRNTFLRHTVALAHCTLQSRTTQSPLEYDSVLLRMLFNIREIYQQLDSPLLNQRDMQQYQFICSYVPTDKAVTRDAFSASVNGQGISLVQWETPECTQGVQDSTSGKQGVGAFARSFVS
ncbi:hypothetical protein MVEN_02335300 [Mycena venus]|uniref:DUF6535 domain-containing protein n=1 Tax=Mycena venus TaxID=2733690 RepID=A0A8H6X444_9AGAR|nr:hypothetical protein MVEN_02335300 [Mycena venus]